MSYINFQPKDNFKAGYYSGTGAELAITGNDHQPDFLWIKQANGTDAHVLFDAVRGATKYVKSSSTDAEATNAQTVKSFDSDGFTLGTDGAVNSASNTYVSLSWKAGTTSGIATDGDTTITPDGYSFNQTSRFSVIEYTGNGVAGAKLPHGLGVEPELIFVKSTNLAGEPWQVYTKTLGNAKRLFLNLTNAETAATEWNSTTPDSVNVTLGNGTHINSSGNNFIAYCFAPKKGFSRFGAYTGNGTTGAGPYIYTGFKPGFIMLKRTDSTANWNMYNMTLNRVNKTQFFHHEANANTQWYDNQDELDVFQNGFRPRGSSKAYSNVNAGTYLYMCFAEEPLVSSNNIPGVAR